MRLNGFLATVLLALLATGAAAQSVSPMKKSGTTLTARKAFYVTVSNPYPERMTFSLTPMEPGYHAEAKGTRVLPPEVTLGSHRQRRVIFMFDIPEGETERKVSLCVAPEGLASHVRPRVCGTYVGRRIGRRRQ